MNTTLTNTTLSFNREPIFKVIYAESALHALNNRESRPSIITEDNKTLLTTMLINGYFDILGSLCPYLLSFDIDDIDNGNISMDIQIPSSL